MRKLLFIVRECRDLVRRHRLYFLLPILIVLAVLSFLVFQIGPALILSFIYAGL
jgi:hypothetical protein